MSTAPQRVRTALRNLDKAETALNLAIRREFPVGSKVMYSHGKYWRHVWVVQHNPYPHSTNVIVRSRFGREYWLDGSQIRWPS